MNYTFFANCKVSKQFYKKKKNFNSERITLIGKLGDKLETATIRV